MKGMIVLMAMTAAFAVCAAASIEYPADHEPIFDAADQPVLTQGMIREFADSVEQVMGVTLTEAQSDELHELVTRAWRLRDEHGMSLVNESIECWRPLRELPAGELAALARRTRGAAVAQISAADGELERWLLDVHRAAGGTGGGESGDGGGATSVVATAPTEEASP